MKTSDPERKRIHKAHSFQYGPNSDHPTNGLSTAEFVAAARAGAFDRVPVMRDPSKFIAKLVDQNNSITYEEAS